MDVGMCACVISAREVMYIVGMTAQICQVLDCSPNEHTHASMGCPILFKSSAFKQEGVKRRRRRRKKPFAFGVSQDYQTSQRL